MTHEKLDAKKAELISYLGQLTDLKCGQLGELVLSRENTKTINLLWEVISKEIRAIDEFYKMDKEYDRMAQLEQEKEYHYCTKCGERRILGDEDSLCGECVPE